MTTPNARSSSGRFAPAGAAPRFDLRRSLEKLFAVAEKKGDFAGCATIARVIRDLSAADPAAAPQGGADDIDWFTAAEMNELLAVVDRAEALREAAKARRAAGEPK